MDLRLLQEDQVGQVDPECLVRLEDLFLPVGLALLEDLVGPLVQ